MSMLFLATAFFSEIIGTVAGFGSSTVLLPFALTFFDFKTALAVVAFFHIFGNISRLAWIGGSVDWRVAIRFGVPSIVMTAAGALLAAAAPQTLLKMILGAFLALFAASQFFLREYRLPAGRTAPIVGGASSGFLAGLIGTGGALRGAFLLSMGLAKERYAATAAVIALAVDVTRIPLYVSQGFFDARLAADLAPLFIIAGVGAYAGRRLIEVMPGNRFRQIVLIALFAVGVKFIRDGI